MEIEESSSARRARNRARSRAIVGAEPSSVLENFGSPPSISALRRAICASSESVRARFSRNVDAAPVSSIRSRVCPTFTISPSRMRISERMPPSRFCTTWIWLDGITRPVPTVTSSSGARLAQKIAAANASTIVNSNRLADRRGPSRAAARKSAANSVSRRRRSDTVSYPSWRRGLQ